MTTSLAAIAIAGLITTGPSNTLSVHLIRRCPATAKCLPPAVIARMKAEAAHIWSSLDVRIAWIDSIDATGAGRAVDLKVMLEETGSPTAILARDGFVLAALHQPDVPCGPGLARVWVGEVQQFAAAARSQAFPLVALPDTLADLLLARALGRALAHEIGHYLLPGVGHTSRGLMRERFVLHELLEAPTSTRYGLAQRERDALWSCRSAAALPAASSQ